MNMRYEASGKAQQKEISVNAQMALCSLTAFTLKIGTFCQPCTTSLDQLDYVEIALLELAIEAYYYLLETIIIYPSS